MLFLLTLETLLVVALLILINAARQSTITHRHLLLLLGWGAGVVALASSFGLFDGPTVRGDATNHTPSLVLVCGLLSAAWFGMQAWSLGRSLRTSNQTRINVPFGIALLSLVGSMYLLFTAADHWWFFRTTDAGVANLSGLDVHEVKCDMALVRLEEHRAVYRCPQSVVFNASHSAPFVPWPHYDAGVSRRLKVKLDEILQAADDGDRQHE